MADVQEVFLGKFLIKLIFSFRKSNNMFAFCQKL